MTIREIEQLLRSCKDAPEFGGDYSDKGMERMWQKVAADIGIDPNTKPYVVTWRDYLEYFSYQLSHVWMRPASVALSIFAIMFGGWIATVNASFDSIPGDVLYPVKLATERVQITLATSGGQRAKLHAEFAGRRLDEITTITSSTEEGNDVRVKAAVDGFKQEIASVNEELVSIQLSDPAQAAELAMIVDSKTDAFAATIAQNDSSVPEESKSDVAGALTVAEESNTQAVNTIVQSHESNQQQGTEEAIQKNFQDELTDLNTRTALSLGRLSVIENVLTARGVTNTSFTDRIKEARVTVNSHDAAIHEAMNTFAVGGYRKAFDLLAVVEVAIVRSEEIITELEIEITTTSTSSGSTTGL